MKKIYYGPEPFISPPTANVVYGVIKKLKLNRAPGDDCINAELRKNGGKHLWKCIFDLILEIWNKEVMPADWKTAVICPIHKKGSKLKCNNYRGISLLNVTYKIFTNILTKYIETYTEEFYIIFTMHFLQFKNYIPMKCTIFSLYILYSLVCNL
jgi:hypothetical protein